MRVETSHLSEGSILLFFRRRERQGESNTIFGRRAETSKGKGVRRLRERGIGERRERRGVREYGTDSGYTVMEVRQWIQASLDLTPSKSISFSLPGPRSTDSLTPTEQRF